MKFQRNLVLLVALGTINSAMAKTVVNIPNGAFMVDVSNFNSFNVTKGVLDG